MLEAITGQANLTDENIQRLSATSEELVSTTNLFHIIATPQDVLVVIGKEEDFLHEKSELVGSI